MTRTPLAFFLAASTLTLVAQGADAAFLNPPARIVGSSVVLKTHGCHKLCQRGPYDNPARHRHMFGSCAPTQFPCIFDWGWVLGQEPVTYKRRQSP